VLVVIAEPSALIGLAVVAAIYARGVRRVWARAGRGRGIRPWQAATFAGGVLGLLVALESPIDQISSDLFAMHMLQHLLLILLAAPLLVLSAPLAALMWGLPKDVRHSAAVLARCWPAMLGRPAVAFSLHVLALWAWHVPALYEAAEADRLLHVIEHACFLGTGMLFWSALLQHRAASGAAVLYVFGMAIQSTALGALLTFARAPWYSSHLTTTAAWGLSPLEDQQLAGLIMWVPGGLIYLAAALGLFGLWLKAGETPHPAAHIPARR
jgi:putative membrane protein